jgi:hypothetical protein
MRYVCTKGCEFPAGLTTAPTPTPSSYNRGIRNFILPRLSGILTRRGLRWNRSIPSYDFSIPLSVLPTKNEHMREGLEQAQKK